MLIEFLRQGAWAMKQVVQTGLFLSEKDAVLPNTAWQGEPSLLETLDLSNLSFMPIYVKMKENNLYDCICLV